MTKSILVAFMAAVCVLAEFSEPVCAQTPPPHPRIMFTAASVPEIMSRVNTPGSLSAQAYAGLASSAGWSSPGLGAWQTMASLRKIHEVSLRYALTGTAVYGDRARNAIMAAIGTPTFTPTGLYPYQFATYAASLAISYDLIHDHLTVAQRAPIISHLEQWILALQSGSNVVGSYASYGGCTDNYSFSWASGLVVCLLSIWGESSQANILPRALQNLNNLRDGWLDAVSPDGSMDESYGYMNYGELWSLYAGMAAEHCGLGDFLSGTNIVKSQKWLSSSLLWDSGKWSLPWFGDSSGQHKGIRWDPIAFYPTLMEDRIYLR